MSAKEIVDEAITGAMDQVGDGKTTTREETETLEDGSVVTTTTTTTSDGRTQVTKKTTSAGGHNQSSSEALNTTTESETSGESGTLTTTKTSTTKTTTSSSGDMVERLGPELLLQGDVDTKVETVVEGLGPELLLQGDVDTKLETVVGEDGNVSTITTSAGEGDGGTVTMKKTTTTKTSSSSSGEVADGGTGGAGSQEGESTEVETVVGEDGSVTTITTTTTTKADGSIHVSKKSSTTSKSSKIIDSSNESSVSGASNISVETVNGEDGSVTTITTTTTGTDGSIHVTTPKSGNIVDGSITSGDKKSDKTDSTVVTTATADTSTTKSIESGEMVETGGASTDNAATKTDVETIVGEDGSVTTITTTTTTGADGSVHTSTKTIKTSSSGEVIEGLGAAGVIKTEDNSTVTGSDVKSETADNGSTIITKKTTTTTKTINSTSGEIIDSVVAAAVITASGAEEETATKVETIVGEDGSVGTSTTTTTKTTTTVVDDTTAVSEGPTEAKTTVIKESETKPAVIKESETKSATSTTASRKDSKTTSETTSQLKETEEKLKQETESNKKPKVADSETPESGKNLTSKTETKSETKKISDVAETKSFSGKKAAGKSAGAASGPRKPPPPSVVVTEPSDLAKPKTMPARKVGQPQRDVIAASVARDQHAAAPTAAAPTAASEAGQEGQISSDKHEKRPVAEENPGTPKDDKALRDFVAELRNMPKLPSEDAPKEIDDKAGEESVVVDVNERRPIYQKMEKEQLTTDQILKEVEKLVSYAESELAVMDQEKQSAAASLNSSPPQKRPQPVAGEVISSSHAASVEASAPRPTKIVGPPQRDHRPAQQREHHLQNRDYPQPHLLQLEHDPALPERSGRQPVVLPHGVERPIGSGSSLAFRYDHAGSPPSDFEPEVGDRSRLALSSPQQPARPTGTSYVKTMFVSVPEDERPHLRQDVHLSPSSSPRTQQRSEHIVNLKGHKGKVLVTKMDNSLAIAPVSFDTASIHSNHSNQSGGSHRTALPAVATPPLTQQAQSWQQTHPEQQRTYTPVFQVADNRHLVETLQQPQYEDRQMEDDEESWEDFNESEMLDGGDDQYDLPRKKKFADSSFFEDGAKSYPTIDEQKKLAKNIAQSLEANCNVKAKGYRMYKKRQRKSDRWTFEDSAGRHEYDRSGIYSESETETDREDYENKMRRAQSGPGRMIVFDEHTGRPAYIQHRTGELEQIGGQPAPAATGKDFANDYDYDRERTPQPLADMYDPAPRFGTPPLVRMARGETSFGTKAEPVLPQNNYNRVSQPAPRYGEWSHAAVTAPPAESQQQTWHSNQDVRETPVPPRTAPRRAPSLLSTPQPARRGLSDSARQPRPFYGSEQVLNGEPREFALRDYSPQTRGSTDVYMPRSAGGSGYGGSAHGAAHVSGGYGATLPRDHVIRDGELKKDKDKDRDIQNYSPARASSPSVVQHYTPPPPPPGGLPPPPSLPATDRYRGEQPALYAPAVPRSVNPGLAEKYLLERQLPQADLRFSDEHAHNPYSTMPRESRRQTSALSATDFERLRLSRDKNTHNQVSPEMCFNIAQDLKCSRGKGARLFAKRQTRSNKFIVDESHLAAAEASHRARRDASQYIMQQEPTWNRWDTAPVDMNAAAAARASWKPQHFNRPQQPQRRANSGSVHRSMTPQPHVVSHHSGYSANTSQQLAGSSSYQATRSAALGPSYNRPMKAWGSGAANSDVGTVSASWNPQESHDHGNHVAKGWNSQESGREYASNHADEDAKENRPRGGYGEFSSGGHQTHHESHHMKSSSHSRLHAPPVAFDNEELIAAQQSAERAKPEWQRTGHAAAANFQTAHANAAPWRSADHHGGGGPAVYAGSNTGAAGLYGGRNSAYPRAQQSSSVFTDL